MMNGQGKSDRPEVPGKSLNNAGQPGAEGMEGSGLDDGLSHEWLVKFIEHRIADRPSCGSFRNG